MSRKHRRPIKPSPHPVRAFESYTNYVMRCVTQHTASLAPAPKDAPPAKLAEHRAYIKGRTDVLTEFSDYFQALVKFLDAEYAQQPMTLAEMLETLADPSLYNRG